MAELIPKKPSKLPAWPNFLFYISLILVIVSAAGYFFLDNSAKEAQSALEKIENQLKETPEEIAELEKELLFWQKKISIFSDLRENHLGSSQVFSFIEEITHPEVSWASFKLSSGEKNLSLSGSTDGLVEIKQQLIILEEEERIIESELKGFSQGKEGEVKFSVDITLKEGVLKQQ